MRYYEKDGLKIPKKYRRMSLEQLDRSCKAFEKTATVSSKIMPSPKKVVNTNVRFDF